MSAAWAPHALIAASSPAMKRRRFMALLYSSGGAPAMDAFFTGQGGQPRCQLGFVVEGQHGQQRAETVLADDAEAVGMGFEDGRLQEMPLGQRALGDRVAAGEQIGALAVAAGDMGQGAV